jgi:hypothetical protein
LAPAPITWIEQNNLGRRETAERFLIHRRIQDRTRGVLQRIDSSEDISGAAERQSRTGDDESPNEDDCLTGCRWNCGEVLDSSLGAESKTDMRGTRERLIF